MIYFQISCQNPASQFLQIQLDLDILEKAPLSLQLPAWRAGRYQLANFAQNIRWFRVIDENGKEIPFRKTSKDRWEIEPGNSNKMRVTYEYWAGKMDADSAWVDDEQVYINLVNCCFEVVGRSEEEIQVELNLPDFAQLVSTLTPTSPATWRADNFQMLADSTVLAAKKLILWKYREGSTNFHIWIHGEVHFDKALFLERFSAFSRKLIQDFGEFPEPEYHFIFQLLPYPHYHGVEHRRGTVITFGPAESLQDTDQMEELLGVSCHELYHAWNVCRIRPMELLPYDFSKETYTHCGLILEGVTTYMGDLYLLKSGVYDLPTYLRHLEKVLQREAAGFGWKNYTIQESSYDLWLDGYVPGIPDRKVNIYSHGALLALCIDILLLKNGSSLSQVMRKMWVHFGKPFTGYEFGDFEDLILDEFSEPDEIRAFFSEFVHGYEDLFPALKALLPEIGLSIEETFGDDWLLHKLGVRTSFDGIISQLQPDSKASLTLMRNDRIVDWPVKLPMESENPTLQIERNGRLLEVQLSYEDKKFFPLYRLVPKESTSLSARWKA
jgi:predicted metalloprotease with PDZ domain